jgi:hypothetical protein
LAVRVQGGLVSNTDCAADEAPIWVEVLGQTVVLVSLVDAVGLCAQDADRARGALVAPAAALDRFAVLRERARERRR